MRFCNLYLPSADVIDDFIVDHEGTVRVLEGGVSTQGGVIRLNYSCSNLGKYLIKIIE